jgi:hypothetical protein
MWFAFAERDRLFARMADIWRELDAAYDELHQ